MPPLPYTHYACPCNTTTTSKLPSNPPDASDPADAPLNPHDPRTRRTLHPLPDLFFCDECDALRCPRCCIDDLLYTYCPSCLFEVPGATVRADANRCGPAMPAPPDPPH